MLLIGAGGHARALVEATSDRGAAVAAYVDPNPAPWLDAPRYGTDDEALKSGADDAVLGVGGVTPAQLRTRLALMSTYQEAGFRFGPMVHPAATVSANARLGDGSHVFAGAVVQPGVTTGRAAIVNTGAIVEHETSIGDGAHVAPGAVVLGRCTVGTAAMIGAGAVVLPGSTVPEDTVVPALGRFPR